MVKRLSDILLSSVTLLVFSPVFLIVSILIKLEDGGPVFYRGVRIGKNGAPFSMFKFRTMVVNADKRGPSSTKADDPRMTRAGKWIRRFNLDELAQLINVFRGEMSIVGPRPQVPWAVNLFTEEERPILSVRPGITDWATLWIRDEGELLRGSSDPDRDYLEKIWPEKRRLQLEYIKNNSIWVDFVIMFKTLKSHLFDRITQKDVVDLSGNAQQRSAP